ncbi:MAG: DUF177 domain-containing protein [Gammaproteobacteria bacterium]|nr:DUF177 domain-containing protein [Gammaproteobacteria bacterium]
MRLAESGETISGSLQLRALQRLGRWLRERDGVVEFRLEFSKDDRGVVRVKGQFSTELTVACQRCLEPLVLRIAQPIEVDLAADTIAVDEHGAGDEPGETADGPVHLASFIEDEVLLGMPMAPRHDPARCPKPAGTEASSARVSPFAVLKDYHPEKS